MEGFISDEEMEKLEEDPPRGLAIVPPRPSGFISDEDMDRQSPDDAEWLAVDAIRGLGQGLNSTMQTVDKYTMAPIRAGVGHLVGIETKKEEPTALSYMIPGAALGEIYGENAPEWKDIVSKMGMSEDEFPIPLNVDPTGRKMRVSPAGLAGGALDLAADPFNLVGIGEAKAIGGIGRKMAGAGENLGNFAAERAVKAATGESKPNLRRFANVKGNNARDAQRATERIRNSGRILLEKDPNFGGEPAIGWLDTARDIGEEAERRRRFYGEQIASVGSVADKYAPGYITPQHLSDDTLGLTRGLLNIGEDKQIRRGLLEEAKDMQRPLMAEDEIGPQGPLKFSDLQNIKNRYKFTPPSGQASANAADIESKLKGNVGKRMDEWVRAAKESPHGRRLKQQTVDELGNLHRTLGPLSMSDLKGATGEQLSQYGRLLDDAKNVTNEFKRVGPVGIDSDDLEKLNAYPHAKSRYGTYENASAAGANQSLNTLNRNIFSPSSKLAAATTFLADAKSGGLTRAAQAAGAAGVNQSVLNRGNAFAARAANALAQKLSRNARIYNKYFAPLLQTGAIASNSGLLAVHHQLMNNDPEYRALMLSGDGQAEDDLPLVAP